ncbi:hypothetical protein [Amycolatopsis thermoflava]|uniref:hypothetical protein n=1 Tax=Amycolatopsis thermoflava TaxID=84480 RepID=UPI0006889F4A|nr:hypothetical protein [Amycolatopsis thermoflava]
MTRVVGIDPSLTGTGLATITSTDGPAVRVISSEPTPDPTLIDRDMRLELIVHAVETVAAGADLAVIEGPALGKASPHTWERAGLWWRIVNRLIARQVPLAVCPPTVRAKWATGKGNAGKAPVVAAIARMWPDVELVDDNAADALVFATMGAQRVGLAVPLARHRDALASVEWPAALQAA